MNRNCLVTIKHKCTKRLDGTYFSGSNFQCQGKIDQRHMDHDFDVTIMPAYLWIGEEAIVVHADNCAGLFRDIQ